MRKYKRRALHRLDNLGHRERFAGAGDAQQNLIELTGLDTRDKLGDRLRLVASRFVVRGDTEALAAVEFGPAALGPVGRPNRRRALGVGQRREPLRRHIAEVQVCAR